MSKLADLIRRATRVEPAPMGFAAKTAQAPATMLVLAAAGERWKASAADAVAAGADALLFTGHPGDRDAADAIAAAGERPCGLLAPDATADQLPHLRSIGFDFVVLEPESPASALLDEDMTLLLRLRQELTDVQLRTLDALPLSAVYIEREGGPITIWRQMELQRVHGLTRKPLVVRAQADTHEQDLLALREAGVALLAVEIKDRDAAGTLRHLRSSIDSLPARRRARRDERPTVTVPSAPGQPAQDSGEEDDDEES